MQDSKKDKRVEITAYQLDGMPFFLEKNVIKDDIIHGLSPKHYYFDIAKDEYGDIALDFKRGSGFIYASVQNRTMKEPMTNPDWRGLYRFPKANDDSLKYRTYGKKIIISEKDTEYCEDGCYVLITIEGNMDLPNEITEENSPFRISINPRVIKANETIDMPKVLMNVNEFVIGDLILVGEEKRSYDYYTVKLPFESDFVIFDFQADSPTLIVNVGPERPTIQTDCFNFPPVGSDTVYKLTKEEILERAKLPLEHGLKGVELTIGIYSNYIDSIQSSPYAFKLFMPPSNPETGESLNIIHIRSDQKVQCLQEDKDYKGSCIFAVIFDDMDFARNMIVYPRSKEGYLFKIFGKFVDSESIERNDVPLIKNEINLIYNKSEYEETGIYVYKEGIEKDQVYLFMVVEEDNVGDIIEVYSSTYSYKDDMNLYPNPSTPQIFAIANHTINLNFITTQDLLINIVSLFGAGTFKWNEIGKEDREFFLEGYDDRLSLTTYTPDEENKIAPLNVASSTTMDKKGFVFYVTYYPRSYVDQMKQGRSTEIHYRTPMMPLFYFAEINRYLSWTIDFNFYEMILKDNKGIKYDKTLFKIWATVLSKEKMIKARFDPNFKPKYDPENSILGVFDEAFGTLFLSMDDIKRILPSSDEENEKPYIFLSVEQENKNIGNFTNIGLELSIYSDFSTTGDNTIPEGVYLHGSIFSSTSEKLIYLLKLDKERPWIQVEFASNSDSIKFILSANLDKETSDDFQDMEIVEELGRQSLIAHLTENIINNKLYLIIFRQGYVDKNSDNFIFEYSLEKSNESFINLFEKGQDKLDVEDLKNNKYKVSFNLTNFDVTTYYIKAVYASNNREKIDTISLSEASGYNLIINNPPQTEQKIYQCTLEATEEVLYIKVMAKVTWGHKIKYYLYEPYKLKDAVIEGDNVILQKVPYLQTIPFNTEKNSINAEAKEANLVQNYELTFPETETKDLPKYIKVVAKPLANSNINSPILYFSPDSEEGRLNRKQLAKGDSLSNEMWIKKEQFENGRFFLNVQCEDESKCGYTLNFTGHDEVIFETMRTFTYYVSEENKQMKFSFKNENEAKTDELTLYATGGKDINLQFDPRYETNQTTFEEGAAITLDLAGKSFDYFHQLFLPLL